MTKYKDHWEKVYETNELEKFGWYEKESVPSLQFIKDCGLPKEAKILDVGSGTTTLIPSLLELGYRNIFVNDISENALKLARQNLPEHLNQYVKWIQDDITNPRIITSGFACDLWHDRTVLHFLTDENSIAGYINTVKNSLKRGGFVIIAVFSLEGAKKCSGLPVKNYDHNMISGLLGDEFDLIKYMLYNYTQPSGNNRPFVYTLFKRK